MSNAAVGNLYAIIIDRIVEAARNDFEEGGIPQETLEELKTKWRENLSSLQVAQLPWDPPPTPPQPAHPPAASSSIKADPSAAAAAAQAKNGGAPAGGAYVKQEPKQEPSYQGYTNGFTGAGLNPGASQRAAQMLHQQYGSQANASIHAVGLAQQSGPRPLTLPGQQQARPTHIQLPGQGQPPPANGSQYPQQPNSLGAAQTDGSGDVIDDWQTVVADHRAAGPQGRRAADITLRALVEGSASLTDSGLFVPANMQTRPTPTAIPSSSLPRPAYQVDGGDDDEDQKPKIEADEDAINSDLDDEDDVAEAVDDDGDGPVGETILCTYDKVQRVKNKWKCTLKDGILTTQGREYVFHKANGEFECRCRSDREHYCGEWWRGRGRKATA